MKLSKSKLALAKVINENGGWLIGGDFNFVTSSHSGAVKFFHQMPRRDGANWVGGSRWLYWVDSDEQLPKWHKTILSREEYYQAYPKADADGWIDHNGKSNPVGEMDVVDVLFGNGRTSMSMCAGKWNWGWAGKSSASGFLIEKYRLHKPDIKPEFCESVTRSIPGSESIDELCAKVTEENKHQHVDAKPTIEQLAQGCRNKLDFANSKQQEADEAKAAADDAKAAADDAKAAADDAKAAADAALGELERAGEVLGILIGIAKSDREPELVITDWRDLKVGDVVEITGSSNNCWKDHSGQEMTVKNVYPDDGHNDSQVYFIGESGAWYLGGNTTWRFIRRP